MSTSRSDLKNARPSDTKEIYKFPSIFRTVIDYLLSSTDSSSGATVQSPVGMVTDYAGPVDSIPSGWLMCDGSSVNRETYKELFAAIGTLWGTTNSTDFYLPDCRRRFSLGYGGTKAFTATTESGYADGGQDEATEIDTAVGSTGGAEKHKLLRLEMPAQDINMGFGLNNGKDGKYGASTDITYTNAQTASSTGYVAKTETFGAGVSISLMPPSIVFCKIIKALP